MQKMIRYLGVLLAAQLLLAIAMSHTGPDLVARRPDTPLFDLAGRSIDRIVIDGPDRKQLVLARQGADWVLPGTGNFPADRSKVDQLLERLEGLKHGLAVATTSGARQRFKVSDKDFERRIRLAQGDSTLATLYFGTSPGLRQVHARSSDDSAVYTTQFGIYDAPVSAADWEDKGVLHTPRDTITSIALAGLTLQREPDAATAGKPQTDRPADKPQTPPATHWGASGLAEGETVNQAGANALAGQLAGLNIAAVLGREAKPDYGLDKPALTLTLTRDGGSTAEYRIGKHDKDFVLKSSTRPEYFRLVASVADDLVKAAGRDRLVQAATRQDTPPPQAAVKDHAGGATPAAPVQTTTTGQEKAP